MLRRSLISWRDLSDENIRTLVELSYLSADRFAGLLEGKLVGLFFSVPSTRTRSAFWRAALDMSAQIMVFGAEDLQTKTGETYRHTGRIIANVADILVVRTNGPESDMHELASGGLSVINAMSQQEHPTQAIADYAAIIRHFGPSQRIRLSYFGEGNNTAAALALMFSIFPGAELHFYMPSALSLPADVIETATARAKRNGAEVYVKHSVPRILPPTDIIYTTRWQTMGQPHLQEDWREQLEPFRVDDVLFDRAAAPGAVFMHDLPAVMGDEVTRSMLEGSHSIVWDQAFHKITAAKVVLAWCKG